MDELYALRDRVLDLAARVRQACMDKLASFCGPEAVTDLPAVPEAAEFGALPEAPAFDDAKTFEAWRDELTALSFERGKKAGLSEGEKQGFDRGLNEGEQKGQRQALFTILQARGIPVDADARARIEACVDPAVLTGWIARAMTVATTAALFVADASPDGGGPAPP